MNHSSDRDDYMSEHTRRIAKGFEPLVMQFTLNLILLSEAQITVKTEGLEWDFSREVLELADEINEAFDRQATEWSD